MGVEHRHVVALPKIGNRVAPARNDARHDGKTTRGHECSHFLICRGVPRHERLRCYNRFLARFIDDALKIDKVRERAIE